MIARRVSRVGRWRGVSNGIVAANNAPAPMWLRANRRRNSRDAYRDVLGAVDIAADTHEWLPDALRLHDSVDPSVLPGFADGDVSVQDGAPQLAVELLAPAPGNRVLDACAAPGGKTAHVLEREPRLDSLLALDLRKERAELVRATLKRLKLGATVKVASPVRFDAEPVNRALYGRYAVPSKITTSRGGSAITSWRTLQKSSRASSWLSTEDQYSKWRCVPSEL